MANFYNEKIDWLIFAEKGTQATDIAKAIFDKGKPTGKITDGGLGGTNISSILSGTVVVARAQGHLFEMLYPQDQDPKYSREKAPELDEFGFELSGFSIKNDEEMLDVYPVKLDTDNIKFDYKLNANSKTNRSNAKSLSKNIYRLYKQADRVVVATDSDAEGEMIFRNWLRNEVHIYKNLPKDKLYRVLITNLDEVSIRNAFKTTMQRYDQMTGKLGLSYQSLAPQGSGRAIADYEYGLSYTLYGKLVGKYINSNKKVPGRAFGRFKNAILGHVRQAEHAYDEFVPSSRYRIDLKTKNGVTVKGTDSLIFDTKAQAQEFIDAGTLPKEVLVHGVKNTTNELPPQMFNRTKLLVAADKLPISVPDWGQVLQTDYETHKILAYPRSDSRYLTTEVFKTLKNEYVQSELIQQLMNERIAENAAKVKDGSGKATLKLNREANKRWVNDTDAVPHYAVCVNPDNLPTESQLMSITKAEKALFMLDLYQTMSIFVSDAINEKMTVKLVEKEDGTSLFSQTYNHPVEQGWRLLVGDIKKGDEVPEEGSQAVEYIISEVKAKRPSLLTPSSLLDLLTSRNEGTSATRDQTINVMVKSRALVSDKKALRVDPFLGEVVDFLLQKGWINMDQTSEWQKELDKVQTDEDADKFIERVRSATRELQKEIVQEFRIGE